MFHLIAAKKEGLLRLCHRREMAAAPEKGATILVADSDFTVRNQLADLLSRQGYRIVQASSGTGAFAAIQRDAVDLVVTAMVMDGMDGFDLLRALRDLKSRPPILAVSSGDETIDQINLRGALLLGASKVCPQPLSSPAFLGQVRGLLGQPA